MELEIVSKKNGVHICYFDDKYAELILSMKWNIMKCGSIYYARNIKFICTKNKRSINKVTLMHRLIMPLCNGHIDHIDGNGLNNKRNNLRECTRCQNMANRRVIQKNNTIGFKGVYYEPKKKLFRVMIGVNGGRIRGGRFKNPIDAAKKYNELAMIYHGEYARLNIIPK